MHSGGDRQKAGHRVGTASRCYKIGPDKPHAAGLVDNCPESAGSTKKFGLVVSGLRKERDFASGPRMGRICG